jgi:hypothetical protein
MDVNAVDLTGADPVTAADLEIAAAGSTKRIVARAGEQDWHATPGIGRMRGAMEIKTVWHPIGM